MVLDRNWTDGKGKYDLVLVWQQAVFAHLFPFYFVFRLVICPLFCKTIRNIMILALSLLHTWSHFQKKKYLSHLVNDTSWKLSSHNCNFIFPYWLLPKETYSFYFIPLEIVLDITSTYSCFRQPTWSSTKHQFIVPLVSLPLL